MLLMPNCWGGSLEIEVNGRHALPGLVCLCDESIPGRCFRAMGKLDVIAWIEMVTAGGAKHWTEVQRMAGQKRIARHVVLTLVGDLTEKRSSALRLMYEH
jgi:hypothetical protein